MSKYTAKCKCGEVEFAISKPPILSPNCSCNDCVTAAYYVDTKAKRAGVENISLLEPGNPQSANMCICPPSGITLVKGRDKLAFFKLRPSSKSARCYTTCCYTTIVAGVGSNLPTVKVAIPMNRATLTPPVAADMRVNLRELVHPETFPKDNLLRSQTVPCSGMFTFICALCCGTGGPSPDPATHSLLNMDISGVTDVAGKEAYAACGFSTENIK